MYRNKTVVNCKRVKQVKIQLAKAAIVTYMHAAILSLDFSISNADSQTSQFLVKARLRRMQ